MAINANKYVLLHIRNAKVTSSIPVIGTSKQTASSDGSRFHLWHRVTLELQFLRQVRQTSAPNEPSTVCHHLACRRWYGLNQEDEC